MKKKKVEEEEKISPVIIRSGRGARRRAARASSDGRFHAAPRLYSYWQLFVFLLFLWHASLRFSREDSSNVGGGGGAFTRWLREFRRETYKVNATGVGVGGGGGAGGGTYYTTADDGRRRHSFNAHDKSVARRHPDPGPAGPHAAHPPSRVPCRRANSSVAPKTRYVFTRLCRRTDYYGIARPLSRISYDRSTESPPT